MDKKKVLLAIIIPVTSVILGGMVFYFSKKYPSRIGEIFTGDPYQEEACNASCGGDEGTCCWDCEPGKFVCVTEDGKKACYHDLRTTDATCPAGEECCCFNGWWCDGDPPSGCDECCGQECIQCDGTLTKVCRVPEGFPASQVKLIIYTSGQPCCLQCSADGSECIGGYARDCSAGCTETGTSPVEINNLDCYTVSSKTCEVVE